MLRVGTGPAKAPVLLAGDFNFNRSSAVHGLLSRGEFAPLPPLRDACRARATEWGRRAGEGKTCFFTA